MGRGSGDARDEGRDVRFHRGNGVRRLVAFALDWGVMVAWGGLLFGLAMRWSVGDLAMVANPWVAQAVGFAAMTLPVTVYFAVSESSPLRASLGKHIVGLQVTSLSGGRIGLARSLLRNGIKFLPWELGHLVAWQAIASGSAGVPGWVLAPMVLSLGVPLWWICSLLLEGVAPYDRWAGVKVVTVGASPVRVNPASAP
jgi:hypothetical protein